MHCKIGIFRALLLAVCISFVTPFVISCSRGGNTETPSSGDCDTEQSEGDRPEKADCKCKDAKNDAKKAEVTQFTVAERMIADQPSRPRVTMKIIIPDSANRSKTLIAALDKARQEDTTLKAVIIWAYHARFELNGPSFTAGKLEWSSDGRNFNSDSGLFPNPRIELAPAGGYRPRR